MQELVLFGGFPFFVVTDEANTEPDTTFGGQKVKDRYQVDSLFCNGQQCVLCFSSHDVVKRYVEFNNLRPRFAIPVDGPNEFVEIFGTIFDAGIRCALLDYVGDEPTRIAPIGHLLGTMRSSLAGDVQAGDDPGLHPESRRF